VSRRTRAAGFAILALLCAVASAAIASGYRESVDAQLGELREVVVVDAPLPAGETLRGRTVRRSLGTREVPVRFLPPDAIAAPAEAVGRRPVATVPAGSYLLASHFRPPGVPRRDGPTLGHGLQPVEISVTGAGALAALAGQAGVRVDVVVAGEPITGGRARVRVAAEGVRLLALEPASPADGTSPGGDSWSATLALTRRQALLLIEAENFAREIRLISVG
jgi:Flp pilus assembly protein CpaB